MVGEKCEDSHNSRYKALRASRRGVQNSGLRRQAILQNPTNKGYPGDQDGRKLGILNSPSRGAGSNMHAYRQQLLL